MNSPLKSFTLGWLTKEGGCCYILVENHERRKSSMQLEEQQLLHHRRALCLWLGSRWGQVCRSPCARYSPADRQTSSDGCYLVSRSLSLPVLSIPSVSRLYWNFLTSFAVWYTSDLCFKGGLCSVRCLLMSCLINKSVIKHHVLHKLCVRCDFYSDSLTIQLHRNYAKPEFLLNAHDYVLLLWANPFN